MAIDEAKLNAFLGRIVGDVGAVWSASLMVLGEELGLYAAMAAAGPVTPEDIATRTGTDARLVGEWLANQAAGGIVEYDSDSGRFTLPPEQAFVLTDPASPADPVDLILGGILVADDRERLVRAFRGQGDLGWHDHPSEFFAASDRYYAAGYRAALVQDWIPSLEGVEAKLRRGAKVADVGCGYGSSTMILARAYPTSTFRGFDFHEPSIERARKSAADAGVADRVTFDLASVTDYPGDGYDVVLYFDALHDVGDPIAALEHSLETLAPGGTVAIVEPIAGERLEENLNPVGRLFYAGSTILCVPSSLAQDGKIALGNQVPEERWRGLAKDAGYTRFRRAAETPFNRIFELRP
jgi:SAM-dependent methyltransferase